MTNGFTTALSRAREVFDRNLVKRGQSGDSLETNDSPFGSRLATPADANDANLKGMDTNSALRLGNLGSATDHGGEVPLMDYFRFKNVSSAVVQTNGRMLQSGSSETSSSSPALSTRFVAEDGEPCISRCTSTSDVAMSPDCSTPGSVSEENLARKKSIYNLPNRPIEVQARNINHASEDGLERSDGQSGSPEANSARPGERSTEPNSCIGWDLDFDDIEDEDPLWFLRSQHLSFMGLAIAIIKVFFFVPWCISVGGTMLLWPDQLELVAFRAGYVDSVRGIRRFAHWADMGIQFITIFLGFLLCLVWFLPRMVAVLLVVALGSRFSAVWKGIHVDYSVPLGDDDRQTLYLLAMLGEHGLTEGMNSVTKLDTGFFIIPT